MSSALSAPATIVEAAHLCGQTFISTYSIHLLDPQSERDDQLGRLNIWADNLGVFASDTASADF